MSRSLVIARLVWLEILRRKDLYVLLALLGTLLLLLMSLDIFGLGKVVRYAQDIGLLFAWLFSLILTVGTVARQLPQEEIRGTIYPLLAKPLTRAELLLGKWLGGWSIALLATGLFYGVVLLLAAARGGRFDTVALAQAVLLHALALGVVAALALALSTRASYGAAASCTYAVLGAIFLVVPQVPEMVAVASGARADALLAVYYALPHLELFDLRMRLVHGWGPVSGTLVVQLALYGLGWMALLLLLAWGGYRHKHFQRGRWA